MIMEIGAELKHRFALIEILSQFQPNNAIETKVTNYHSFNFCMVSNWHIKKTIVFLFGYFRFTKILNNFGIG